jgi:hypothetical protein
LSYAAMLFALIIFQIGSHIYALVNLNHNSPILCFLHSWDDRHPPPCPAFIGWDGFSETFCPGWPWIVILLISTSQVTRITGMSHCTQLLCIIIPFLTAYLLSIGYIFITISVSVYTGWL